MRGWGDWTSEQEGQGGGYHANTESREGEVVNGLERDSRFFFLLFALQL